MQQLEAHEEPLSKIFGGDYDFKVPHYQRPYAWGTGQAADLLNDLDDALDRNGDEPYFLGSLVLIKRKGMPTAEIIDGQQRLTTLTILFAILGELAEDPDVKKQYGDLIREPGKVLMGLPAKPRLELRPKDAAFFRKYVQEPGGISRLISLGSGMLANDSQIALRDNAIALHEMLLKYPAWRRFKLGQLLVQHTYLVVVSTPDLASAHRIFSVMNARGLDLSPVDVFKSDIIGEIPETQQEIYARKWEDSEEDLGRAEFAELFVHMRMMFSRRRARQELLKEFPGQVLSKFRPGKMESFIDDELIPLARAYCEIRDADYLPQEKGSSEINDWFRRLNQIDNSDWRVPALWALRYHRGDGEFLDSFFKRLERLAASMFIRRVYTSPRVDRYARLLADLDGGAGADAPAFELSADEAEETVELLNGNIYWANSRLRKYLLLRLEEVIAAKGAPILQSKNITIEHVLPQNPKMNSNWRTLFSEEQRELWTHRFGNLVLLNKHKNPSASNLEFEAKKEKYFKGPSGVTTFALTVQVLNESEWTPEVLRRRQEDLIGKLIEAWELT
jgi:hypothetical protein